jgi:hypothetical protein
VVITFGHLSPSYWIDYLGFITEGKLAAIFIKPSLGSIITAPSAIIIINYNIGNPISCARI